MPVDTPLVECDVLVIGSGAAGLAAAVTAAWHGEKVIVVEKDPVFGGATAWSGGWMWVPCNPLAQRTGIIEERSQPRTYLEHELGERFDGQMIDAFLEAAPNMVSFFERHTALQFADGNGIADIHGNTPGAGTGGRSVIAAPYDGRQLGKKLLTRLRKTMRETSFMGMPIMAGKDLGAFLTLTRSWRSLLHVSKRFSRHLLDLATHGRALQLVNGVALVARLAKSAEDLGVLLWESAAARQLIREHGRVSGALIETARGPIRINARKAVVLAAGGFANDVERRKVLFPRTPTGHEHLALPPLGVNGDGLRLGESVGGQVADDLHSPVAWAPVSRVPHTDGSIGHFPHIIDRAKPGIIGVLANGKRFVNEADGYYDYVSAMVAQAPGDKVESWLICSHAFQRRYGLGISRPFPLPVQPLIKSGYLKTGDSIEALARACGIDAQGLVATVAEYNRHARNGEDPQFGRGSTPYNRKQGDALHGPNPCVAPIEQGPFYAVKVEPGCFGTFAGLRTNANAQVLDEHQQAITGLYAVGSDMVSIMGGHYPAGGINLGPAATFGYIAGRHIAGVTTYE
ncbi:FAD-dependent oxidoreductase [Pseudomonas donghuensis]|uniref:FAD-dependent oxidoreductase n=1 Tax=Pseudomonas donghuensis TaxID=1163398 RepID=A0AAP0SN83_9PSED|nr:FAD-dependent oxidoreductase [Pseudomonas donghuensis]KDO01897.1 FAD-dependent oxidoreductase [Pseudomonas donghuensis]MCP6693586.1 FAD-dependent oxidoreductase [Pseudomonas donghuensis]MDF9891601.1 succinate dehydrogenase/fumarate reductase flavoprotein subunit [Pseudomonas vranovensis]